jgi:hypothetical protein
MLNSLLKHKLYFVTVETLVDFYKHQGELAAQGSRTKAQLETQASISKQEIAANKGIAEKRLQQEQMLEQYKQQMETLRNDRSISAEQQQFLTKQLAEDMRARLGKETSLKQTELTQQGAMERELVRLKANAPKLEAETNLATSKAASAEAQRPMQQAKMEAETQLALEKVRLAQSPDATAAMTELDYLRTNKKELRKLDQEGYDRKVRLAASVLTSSGVDPENQQSYLEATSEARKESVAKVVASLNTFADDTIQQGAVSRYLGAKTQLTNWMAEGRITPDDARKRLDALNKKMQGRIPQQYLEA